MTAQLDGRMAGAREAHDDELCAAVTATTTGQDVVVSGRLDTASAPDLRDLLWILIASGEGELRLHLRDVEIGDSTGLGLLAHTHTHARRHGRALLIIDVSERTSRLLRASRLSRVLHLAA